MNKSKYLFLLTSFLFFAIAPAITFASCGMAAHEVDVTTSNGSVTTQCACVSNAIGTYPDCQCPSGTDWASDTESCISTGGGAAGCSACTAVGVPCVNGQCVCPSGQGWANGSSCYPCGANIAGQGTFCGSGCAGYGGCSGTTNSNSNGNTNSNSNTNNNNGTGATTESTTGSTGVIDNPISLGSFADLINAVIKWIIDIALVLAPLIIVYGGFTYITAAGDTTKISKGKQIILYAVMGFILALLAESLVSVIKSLVAK